MSLNPDLYDDEREVQEPTVDEDAEAQKRIKYIQAVGQYMLFLAEGPTHVLSPDEKPKTVWSEQYHTYVLR